jgi:carbonic anhydrase/acetyltransferase-like protein (isoleucine patch superfamily)
MTVKKYGDYFPQVDERAWISEDAWVAGRVFLASHSSVWPKAVIRGDVGDIVIGQYTNIQDGAVLHATHASEMTGAGSKCVVGDFVTVGHNAVLHGCTIENECLVGMGSIILDGALIKKHVLIGANSLVPSGKVLESGYLYVGSPVKQTRPLTDKEKSFFKYSAEHYYNLAKEHEQSGQSKERKKDTPASEPKTTL